MICKHLLTYAGNVHRETPVNHIYKHSLKLFSPESTEISQEHAVPLPRQDVCKHPSYQQFAFVDDENFGPT